MNHNRAAMLQSLQFLQTELGKQKLKEEFKAGTAYGLKLAEKQVRENNAAFWQGTTARPRIEQAKQQAGKKKKRNKPNLKIQGIDVKALPKCLQVGSLRLKKGKIKVRI